MSAIAPPTLITTLGSLFTEVASMYAHVDNVLTMDALYNALAPRAERVMAAPSEEDSRLDPLESLDGETRPSL